MEWLKQNVVAGVMAVVAIASIVDAAITENTLQAAKVSHLESKFKDTNAVMALAIENQTKAFASMQLLVARIDERVKFLERD